MVLISLQHISKLLIYQSNRFLTKDTAIRERVKSTADAAGDTSTPFVDLTICPAYESSYKEDVLRQYGMDKDKYRREGVYIPQNYTPDMDLRNLFEEVTHDIHEVLFSISIYTNSRNNSAFTTDFGTKNFTKHIHITEKYYHYFGRCFSINPREHVLRFGINAIKIVGRVKIYIYFGHPGQFTYSNTKSKVCHNMT